MSKFADRGKWAQDQAQSWLEAMSKSHAGFAYHRYPDSKAARGALPAQPADFIVGWKNNTDPRVVHLEVKETKEANRLPKSKISQWGKLKMFDWAGFRTRVLIYRSALGDWIYMTELDLFKYDEVPASFPFGPRISYPTAANALHDAIFL